MLRLERTTSKNSEFIALVKLLDADLEKRDGDDHAFYHQFNSITQLNYCLVLYSNEKAIACGAIKEFDTESMEVKRMFVLPKERGKGFATKVLSALENWSKELTYNRCVLETGKRQPEAISLYEKSGYQRIKNYGQYKGIENSVCFEKRVIFDE